MSSGTNSHHSQRGAALAISALKQQFSARPILDGIDLDIQPGEVLALLGPSGCGKTTLLRLLAGLTVPSGGTIRMDGTVIAGNGFWVPPEQRELGMVFQDYALWPHMTVGANVAFPLRMRACLPREAARRVADALALVGLTGLSERHPAELSGGQQQRVALARAIVAAPRLLLFDEPLSNLDRDLRETLSGELAQLLRSLGTTAVYVTHDHQEAFTLADRIALLHAGRVLQCAPPEELLHAPANAVVAEFLKLGIVADAQFHSGRWWVGQVALPRPRQALEGNKARVLIPHGAVSIATLGNETLGAHVVAQRLSEGRRMTWLELDTPGTHGSVACQDAAMHKPGEAVGLKVSPEALCWFAPTMN